MVEGRDLEHLGGRQAHLFGERVEVRGRDRVVAVLNLVEVLDQQVAPARLVAEQHADLFEREGIERTAPSGLAAFLPAAIVARFGREARGLPDRDPPGDVDRLQRFSFDLRSLVFGMPRS